TASCGELGEDLTFDKLEFVSWRILRVTYASVKIFLQRRGEMNTDGRYKEGSTDGKVNGQDTKRSRCGVSLRTWRRGRRPGVWLAAWAAGCLEESADRLSPNCSYRVCV